MKRKSLMTQNKSDFILIISPINKLKCCEFKGKQASKIESTRLCCTSYSVSYVIDQKNEWSVFVEKKVSDHRLSCPSASQGPRRRAVDGYINNQDSSPPIITNNTPRD